jgi:hypothetical protein
MAIQKARPLLALAPRASTVQLRASLPIASNRAFIRAWAARRARAVAAAAAAAKLLGK